MLINRGLRDCRKGIRNRDWGGLYGEGELRVLAACVCVSAGVYKNGGD